MVEINIPKTDNLNLFVQEFYAANYFFKPAAKFDKAERDRVEQDQANFGSIGEFKKYHIERIKRLKNER